MKPWMEQMPENPKNVPLPRSSEGEATNKKAAQNWTWITPKWRMSKLVGTASWNCNRGFQSDSLHLHIPTCRQFTRLDKQRAITMTRLKINPIRDSRVRESAITTLSITFVSPQLQSARDWAPLSLEWLWIILGGEKCCPLASKHTDRRLPWSVNTNHLLVIDVKTFWFCLGLSVK